jgi:hypothetical protein
MQLQSKYRYKANSLAFSSYAPDIRPDISALPIASPHTSTGLSCRIHDVRQNLKNKKNCKIWHLFFFLGKKSRKKFNLIFLKSIVPYFEPKLHLIQSCKVAIPDPGQWLFLPPESGIQGVFIRTIDTVSQIPDPCHISKYNLDS